MGGVRTFQTCWVLLSLILPGILSSEWAVHLPSSSVCAMAGSTVVLPCSYNYPRSLPPRGGEEGEDQPSYRVRSEMWCLGEGRCITPRYVYHSAGIFPEPAYLGRVEFLGEPGSRNCSLRISDLRTSDGGTYVFYFITSHPKEKLPAQPGVQLVVAGQSSEDAVLSCEDTVTVTRGSMAGGRLGIIGVAIAVLLVIVVTVAYIRRRRQSVSRQQSYGLTVQTPPLETSLCPP